MASQPGHASSVRARAFRALLRLYPAVYRDEYGRELSLVFADRYRDASGPWDRILLWFEALSGILTEAPKEHIRLIASDVRYALRRLRRSPGFAVTSIATLALAIGASTAMFSVLNAVLLRPLPYDAPDRLAVLWAEAPGQTGSEVRTAYGSFEQWRRENSSFVALAAADPSSATLTRAGNAEQIMVARVSPEFFPLLGVQPSRGRSFSRREAEERRRLAVISHRFWQTRFAGSPEAIGQTIEFDGVPSEVIGILPATFRFPPFDVDVWEPQSLFADWETRRVAVGAGSWFVLGRLRDGVTIDQAQADMTAISRRLDDQLPAVERNRGVRIAPLTEYLTAPGARLALWMLTSAGCFVLLIAAANVAGLSLARSVGRGPEMAIRSALGASRARIVRQMLAESVTLAVIAGLLGLLLALAGIDLIRAFAPSTIVRLDDVSIDLRVLGWALTMSIVTGVLVGLAPAVTVWRGQIRSAGAEGGRGIVGSATARGFRRALVVAQCAVALMLLVGAGLLIRSWWAVVHVDPGFRTDRVLSMNIATPASTAPGDRAPFYERVLEQIAAVPGVESAGVSSELFTSSAAEQFLATEDNRSTPERVRFRSDEVSHAFFTTIGTPLVRGRLFSEVDGPNAPQVAIVSESLATRLWPVRDPIGRRFAVGRGGPTAVWRTVVGVVGNMRRQGLEADAVHQIFQPIAQNASRRSILFVRTATNDPLQMIDALRAAVQRVDTTAVVYRVATLDDRLGEYLSQRRFQTTMLIAFSAVALLLATIGLYGLIQYSVAARTHEIGIRMAVGAEAGDIFRMVIREGVTLSLTGLAIGLVGAVWLARAGASLLFGVTATDPVTFAAVSLLLTAVAGAACFFPARRAMKVEPVVALQQRAG